MNSLFFKQFCIDFSPTAYHSQSNPLGQLNSRSKAKQQIHEICLHGAHKPPYGILFIALYSSKNSV